MPTDFAAIASDLQWLIQSPPLLRLNAPWQTTAQGFLPKPLQCPTALSQKAPGTVQNSTRLGLYYEWLWQQLLQEQPVCSRCNLSIRDEQRTLGEFDLLYRDAATHLTTHRELALKYYLLAPGQRGDRPWHWVGPNPVDRLDLKIDKLANQQIKLTENKIARATLQAQGWEVSNQEILMQGRLFYPGLTTQEPILHPAPIHPSAPWGYWITGSELEAWMHRYRNAQWFALEKLEWISGPGRPVSSRQLKRSAKTGQYRLEVTGQPPIFLMLVEERWPAQAEKSLHLRAPIPWPSA